MFNKQLWNSVQSRIVIFIVSWLCWWYTALLSSINTLLNKKKTIYTDSFLQNHDENDVLWDGWPNMKQTRRNTSNTSSYRGWVPLAKISGNWVVDMKSTHTASWDMSKIPFNNAVNIKCNHRVRHPFTGHLNQMENRPPGTANTASNASNRESV